MGVFKIEPKTNNTNVLEIINTIMLSLGIYLVSIILVPLIPFSVFLIFIVPAPSIVLSIRKGYKYGIITISIVGIAAALFSRSTSSLIILLYMIPLVIIMSSMIKQGESFKRIMTVNIFASVFITIIALLNLQFVMKVDILSQVNSFFAVMSKNIGDLLKSAEFPEEYIKQMVEISKSMKYFLPSMGLIAAIALNYGSFSFTRKLLRKYNIKIEQDFRFIDFRINFKFFAFMLLTAGIAYLLEYFKVAYNNVVILNLAFVYMILFVAAGISLMDYYLIGKIPKALRVVIPFAVLLFLRGDLLFILVAFIDILINFRKRFKRIDYEKK